MNGIDYDRLNCDSLLIEIDRLKQIIKDKDNCILQLCILNNRIMDENEDEY